MLSSLALAACGSRASNDGGSDTPGGAATNNTASDVGVTPTEIRVGVIGAENSPLGPDTFSGSMYGAQAYFAELNARGGVNGRTIKVIPCNDEGSGDGNVACVRKLIDDEEVFAFAGVTAFDYAGAQYADSQGVLDIGGQPVSSAYDQYPHLYSIYGSYYPRDGRRPGYNGSLYAGTETYRWLKETLGARVAGVVYYGIGPSQRYAASIADGLRQEGFEVVEEQINLSAPNWDATVQNLKRRGVQVIFDAMEVSGNGQLCAAMERQGLTVQAKVTTAQGWGDDVRQAYADTPGCRNSLYATSQSANYEDENIPAVAEFRKAIETHFPDRAGRMNTWMLEGYASAQWLTDAIESCGAEVTRECVKAYMDRDVEYDGHGLLIKQGRKFVPLEQPPAEETNCLNVARWQDSANGGQGGWVTQVEDMNTNCFTVPNLAYPAA